MVAHWIYHNNDGIATNFAPLFPYVRELSQKQNLLTEFVVRGPNAWNVITLDLKARLVLFLHGFASVSKEVHSVALSDLYYTDKTACIWSSREGD
jgi:hypothetical protein